MTVSVSLSLIKIDGGTQSREALSEAAVADYEALIRDGLDFPPVVLFYDGSTYWLGDGFHRFFAYKAAGAVELPAEIREGTRRDAILFSVGANAEHGLPRTNEDKRKAVTTLLDDEEWSQWSDREIARRAGVSNRFVSSLRSSVNGSQMVGEEADDGVRTVTRGGTTYQQKTANIGSGRKAEAQDKVANAADRAEATSRRREVQAENLQQRDEARAALPESVKAIEAAKEAARARRPSKAADAIEVIEAFLDPAGHQDRIAELEEAVRVLEAENAELRAENKLFAEMKAEFLKGGFEAVIAGRDETIRVQASRIESESREKVKNLNSFRWAMEELKKLGFSNDIVIDAKTGEVRSA